MPTRKISEREKLTIFARTASDDELASALEILQVEQRVRAASKQPTRQTNKRRPAAASPNSPPKTADDSQG